MSPLERAAKAAGDDRPCVPWQHFDLPSATPPAAHAAMDVDAMLAKSWEPPTDESPALVGEPCSHRYEG